MAKRKAQATTTVIDAVEPGFTQRSRQGRKNRAKGGAHEREVANALKSVWPHARRSIGQAREGSNSPDIVGTPLWFECGNVQRAPIPRKYAQGLSDSSKCVDSNYRDAEVIVVARVDGRNLYTMSERLFVAVAAMLEDAGRWEEVRLRPPAKERRGPRKKTSR